MHSRPPPSAFPRLRRLMDEQIQNWPLMGQGAESLKGLRRRIVAVEGDSVIVQFNPLRVTSSAADVSAEAVAKRPCFLCGENRPSEQKALVLDSGYLALCNPMPIFDMHFTVAHAEHRPQNQGGVLGDMLDLARELGPEMCVFYNGAGAGASAPDHLHFQAACAGALPVYLKVPADCRPVSLLTYACNEYALLTGSDADRLHETLSGLVEVHGRTTGEGSDLLNAAAFFRPESGFQVVAAFRQKHRPAVFFAGEPQRRIISPAAVEMFGVVVTVRESDYAQVDGALLRSIFAEVCKPAGLVLKEAGLRP